VLRNRPSGLFDSEFTSGRTPLTGDRVIAWPLSTQDRTSQKDADIHASSGIRTRDPSVRTVHDIRFLNRAVTAIGSCIVHKMWCFVASDFYQNVNKGS
jgi:hypothetical protein